jgi:hypothetical protein
MTILASLNALSLWQKTAFSAALIQRMLPNYQLFSQATEFGDVAVLKNQLDLIWQKLGDQKIKINLEAQLLKLEDQIPDPEQYDFFAVYPALDCTMALMSLMQGMQNKEESNFDDVSQLSQNSVQSYIEVMLEEENENLSDDELNQAIAEHPLMIWENEMQQECLNLLKNSAENKSTCTTLKTLVLGEGISSLGIEI